MREKFGKFVQDNWWSILPFISFGLFVLVFLDDFRIEIKILCVSIAMILFAYYVVTLKEKLIKSYTNKSEIEAIYKKELKVKRNLREKIEIKSAPLVISKGCVFRFSNLQIEEKFEEAFKKFQNLISDIEIGELNGEFKRRI